MLRSFGISKLVTYIVLISAFAMAVRVPTSPDTWWHLRCGEVQWRTHAVIQQDLFSHTVAGTPWINQSWLPQLAMYGLFTWGGLQALSIAVGLVVAATTALILFASSTRGRYGLFWRALVVLWAIIATGRVWAARPHILTFLWTAAWVYLLDRHHKSDSPGKLGVLAWLPPTMLLWANSHGGHVIGFVLLGAETCGLFFDALWYRSLEGFGTRLRPLLIALLLSLLAALINPQGVRLLTFPFQTLDSSAQQNLIAEWASPDFHAPDLLPFLALLVATWTTLALSGQQVRGSQLVRLLGFTVIALRSGRFLGLCAVVMAPILVEHGALAWTHLGNVWEVRPRTGAPVRGSPLLNVLLFLLILFAAAVKIAQPLNAQTVDQVQRHLFPVQAVAYMRDHDLPPTLFNEYAWGGYLLWHAYPDTPVFIDGRADPYGDELILAYSKTASGQQDWERLLGQYNVHTALIRTDGPLASLMRENEAWQQTYADDLATIFVQVGE